MSGIAITIKGADYSQSGYGRITGEKTTTGLLIDFDVIDNGVAKDAEDIYMNDGDQVKVKDWVSSPSPTLYTAELQNTQKWEMWHGRIVCPMGSGKIMIPTGGRLAGMTAPLNEMTLATVLRLTDSVRGASLGVREWRNGASSSAMRWNVETTSDGLVTLNIHDGGGWKNYVFGGQPLLTGKAYLVAVTVQASQADDTSAEATLYLNGQQQSTLILPYLSLELDQQKCVVDLKQPEELWASLLYNRALSEEEVKSLGGYYACKTGLAI